MGLENSLFPLLTVVVAMIVAGLVVKFIKGTTRTRIRIAIYLPLGLVLLLFGTQWFVSRQKVIRQELLRVGQELCAAGESESVSNLEGELAAQLDSIRLSETRISRISLGDAAPPLGVGRANARLILTNSVGETLGIRFRYAGRGRFEALGSWIEEASSSLIDENSVRHQEGR